VLPDPPDETFFSLFAAKMRSAASRGAEIRGRSGAGRLAREAACGITHVERSHMLVGILRPLRDERMEALERPIPIETEGRQ
jgi:hypothetical protein